MLINELCMHCTPAHSLGDLCGAGLIFSAQSLQLHLEVFRDCSDWSLTSSRNSQKMAECLNVHLNVISGGKRRDMSG